MQVTFLYHSQLLMNGNDRSQDTSTFTYSVLEVMIKLRLLLISAGKLKKKKILLSTVHVVICLVSLIIFYVLHEADFTHMLLS